MGPGSPDPLWRNAVHDAGASISAGSTCLPHRLIFCRSPATYPATDADSSACSVFNVRNVSNVTRRMTRPLA